MLKATDAMLHARRRDDLVISLTMGMVLVVQLLFSLALFLIAVPSNSETWPQIVACGVMILQNVMLLATCVMQTIPLLRSPQPSVREPTLEEAKLNTMENASANLVEVHEVPQSSPGFLLSWCMMDVALIAMLTGLLVPEANSDDSNWVFDLLLLSCLVIAYLKATLEVLLGLMATASRILYLGAFVMLNIGVQIIVAMIPNQSYQSFATLSYLKYIGIVGLPFIFVVSLSLPTSNSVRCLAFAIMLLSKAAVEFAMAFI